MWPLVHGFMDQACSRGVTFTEEEIRNHAVSGAAQLWVVWDKMRGEVSAAAVTHVMNGVCILTALGGSEIDRWFNLKSELESWASMNGCHAMRLYGRLGWKRKMNDYKTAGIVLEKRLTNG